MADDSVILIDQPQPGVRRLRLNRPDARNAINADVRLALIAHLDAAADDPEVRALIIGGTGGMFCAGGDLPSMIGISAAAASERMREGHRIVNRLWHFPKPVVAAVERFAVGAGASICLLADRIVMGENAALGFPFLRLGLVPDWGAMAVLTWRAGPTFAGRVFSQSANVSAQRAYDAGIVDHVVEAGAVAQIALDQTAELAALPLAAFVRMKRGLRQIDLEQSLTLEREAQVACLLGAEFAEGYAAFKEKRRPAFETITMRSES